VGSEFPPLTSFSASCPYSFIPSTAQSSSFLLRFPSPPVSVKVFEYSLYRILNTNFVPSLVSQIQPNSQFPSHSSNACYFRSTVATLTHTNQMTLWVFEKNLTPAFIAPALSHPSILSPLIIALQYTKPVTVLT